MNPRVLNFTLLCMFFTSCTQREEVVRDPNMLQAAQLEPAIREYVAPERVLEDFIRLSFNIKAMEGLPLLTNMTTAEARVELEKLNEAAFNLYFKERQLEFMDFAITDMRKVDALSVVVEYRIGFWDLTPGNNDARYLNHNLAHLMRDADGWKISDIEFLSSIAAFQRGQSIQTLH